jgi:tRNA threonylcarbamoyladenosine biosynthesis protein TsaE
MMTRISTSAAQTRAIATELAHGLASGSVVILTGDLGAGKTEFVKGLAKGLGIDDSVTSPTFTLVHEYRGNQVTLYHLDLYRLNSEKELDEIGFDDCLSAGGICAIEWGNKYQSRLPKGYLEARLTIGDNSERIIEW